MCVLTIDGHFHRRSGPIDRNLLSNYNYFDYNLYDFTHIRPIICLIKRSDDINRNY